MSSFGMFSTGVVVGLLCGVFWRDKGLWDICKLQQKRGDYWCDKYMNLVRDDWPFPVDD